MPIRLTINQPERLVLGIARGDVTIGDLAAFTREVAQAGLLHYRKLIDFTDGVPRLSERELEALATVLRDLETARPRGPLAIVASTNHGSFGQFFAEIDSEARPVRVFKSLREARPWLNSFTIP